MGLFGSRKLGKATAEGESAIRITEADGSETAVDLARLEWLSFVQIGDDDTFVYEGWWLLGLESEAIAVRTDCPTIDVLLRDSPLSEAADRIADKTLVFVASPPSQLRGTDARDGIVQLRGDDGKNIRSIGTQEPVRSVREFPQMM